MGTYPFDEIESLIIGIKEDGVITDKEARKLQVGGEVLAFVW